MVNNNRCLMPHVKTLKELNVHNLLLLSTEQKF